MRRRTFLAATGASALAVLAEGRFQFSGAAVDKAKLSKTLKFNSYGGSWQEALTKAAIEPFEQEFGVKVEQSSHGNEEEALAKMRAAGPSGYDVITVNESGLYVGVKQGLFAELQLENIPNYRYLIPKLQRPPYDPGPGIHSVPDVYGSNAITYNTKYVTRPDSWAVCWDPRYAKHMAVRDSAIYRMFLTALYLGQDPNHITEPNKVYEALRRQRPLVLKYWGGATEMQTLLANGDVWVGEFLGGRTLILKEQGVPVDYVIPKEGAKGYVDCVAVGKGSPNQYTAEAFMNFILQPRIAERIAELTKYPHCLDPRKVHVGSAVTDLPDYDASGTLSRFRFADYAYLDAHRAEWDKEWTQIKVGG